MNNTDDSLSNKALWPKWPLDLVLFFAMAVAGIAVVIYLLQFWSPSFSSNLEHWGQTGDFFGGLLNPAISFATLVVAFAVWKSQKEELYQTKIAIEEQAKTAEQQRREQRFFDLMNIYYQTTNALRFDQRLYRHEQPLPSYGKKAIQEWLSQGSSLWAFTEERGDYMKSTIPFAPGTRLAELQHQWIEGGTHFFGAYLRTMTLIFSRARSLLKEDDVTYVELLKAQLTSGELVAIGYHLLFDQNGTANELIGYAKRYGLLSDLPSGDLREALKDNLPPDVFGESSIRQA